MEKDIELNGKGMQTEWENFIYILHLIYITEWGKVDTKTECTVNM